MIPQPTYETLSNSDQAVVDARLFLGRLHSNDAAYRFAGRGAHYGIHLALPVFDEHGATGRREWRSNHAFVLPGQEKSFDPHDYDGADVYVSLNGFKSKRSRAIDNLFCVNALAFDLDHEGAHKGRVEQSEVETAKQEVQDAIFNAVLESKLPNPTLLTDTGRGLQLIYVLDTPMAARKSDGSANKMGLWVVSNARERICEAIDAILAEHPGTLTNDPAVKDFARVVRVPGTKNSKTGERAKLVHYAGPLHSIASIREFFPREFDGKHYERAPKPVTNQDKSKKAPGKAVADGRGLEGARLVKLRELQKLRESAAGAVGHRNEMAFVFMNSMFAITKDPQKALNETVKFNHGFSKPLRMSELMTTCNGLAKRQAPYRFSRQGIIDHLGLTTAEIAAIGFFQGAYAKDEAREEKKAETRRKRQELAVKILTLAEGGLTYDQIASRVGVSRRTVCNYLKANGYSRRIVEASEPVTAALPEPVRICFNKGYSITVFPLPKTTAKQGVSKKIRLSAKKCPHTYYGCVDLRLWGCERIALCPKPKGSLGVLLVPLIETEYRPPGRNGPCANLAASCDLRFYVENRC